MQNEELIRLALENGADKEHHAEIRHGVLAVDIAERRVLRRVVLFGECAPCRS